jgi:vacuolar protein sorting-associated protein 13A/C
MIEGTNEQSSPFHYDHVHSTLLQAPNKYGGMHVDVHITEASTVITFTEYSDGKAPILVVNYTGDSTIEISEKGVDNTTKVITPGTSQLIAWQDPMGEKILIWSPASTGKRSTYLDKLHGDGAGSYKFSSGSGSEQEYYWVCFLNGLQRVLLFTADSLLANYLQTSREIEVPTSDYTVLLHGIGLSLVNNYTHHEIMYMRLASSDVAWEGAKAGKKQRFKPLADKESQAIEVAYQNYLNEKAISANAKSHLTLDAGIEIDFTGMKMFKPNVRDLRRVFQTGVWVHYKTFPHSTQFHAKFNRLQIDNQLPDSIFHIVLAPVPPPKSVSTSSDVPKPFAEVSIMQRMTAHSTVIQFKYFKVLIQEFHIRLDISFVNALVELFSESGEKKMEHMVEYFAKDYEEACTNMDQFLARHIVSQGQKHFYDFLHFSPLKIHVSFSMGGATQLSNNFLNLLLQSLGVTLTEIQDVVFKLACLELQHLFLSGDQLYAEAYSHYSTQAIKQLYVLVLGLDVIGNPYGLVMGLSEGVEAFFYEPFQGAIQGPGEFAEGLALGVKSLVGHTLGGAAGAMSRITGTLGKGIAALTMDEEYQKKRRENISRRHDVGEGLAQSGKGLVMGFFDGVTGVVTKPFKGAKQEGVGGFFKGLGKGAVGLVARPTAGVVDFTSGTFDAVKKATSVSDEVRRMRPPRHIPTDSILRPYVLHEAEGMQLMHELEKGKFTTTDTYVAHALVNPHGLFVLLLTNKRVIYIKKDEVFGGWGIQWSHIWDDLSGPPDIVEKGLSFKLKTKERKLLRSAKKELLVPLYSPDVCTWMLSKIESAMKSEAGTFLEPSSSGEIH